MSSPNRDALTRLADKLGPLSQEFVFVGGRVAELLVTDPAAVRVRPTQDSDAVVEVAGTTGYHRFGKRLRERGFVEDTRVGAPICRWRSEDDVLDVLPVDGSVLGFRNAWYGHVRNRAIHYELQRCTHRTGIGGFSARSFSPDSRLAVSIQVLRPCRRRSKVNEGERLPHKHVCEDRALITYLPRIVDAELDELLAALPALALEGPKGVGKTETAKRRAKTIIGRSGATSDRQSRRRTSGERGKTNPPGRMATRPRVMGCSSSCSRSKQRTESVYPHRVGEPGGTAGPLRRGENSDPTHASANLVRTWRGFADREPQRSADGQAWSLGREFRRGTGSVRS